MRNNKYHISPSKLHFSRWSNTSFAIFYSIGKEVIIGMISILLEKVITVKSRFEGGDLISGASCFYEEEELDEIFGQVTTDELLDNIANGDAPTSRLQVSASDSGAAKEHVENLHIGSFPGLFLFAIPDLLFKPLFIFSKPMHKMKPLLPALLCALSCTQTVYSQGDSTVVLDDIIISGNRIETPFSAASRNIQVIGKDEIRRAPAQSIPEILLYAPGVDIRQRGPMGVQSDIGIRGGTFEQTLILLNGIKLTDPQTGHHIMSLPIPLDNIHQIEILKGPGARVYGQNAFAGAVNFITKAVDERKVGFRAYGGSFGSLGGNLTVSMPTEHSSTYLSFSGDRSDGYRHNTDYEILNGFLQHDYQLKGGQLNLTFGLSDRKFGANGFYASPDFTEQYEEVRTAITSVSYEAAIAKITLKPRVYWRYNRDKYLFVREHPAAYQNLHETNTYGVELNSTHQGELGISGLGLEYRKEKINGDWVRGGSWSKSNLEGFYRDNFGLYADHRFKLGYKFDFTPGVYVNWYSDFGWNAFPGLDMGYNLNSEVRLYGNIGKSYRVPTFYDQYYSSPVEVGNPDLKPEEALTYEVGLRYLKNGFSLEGNYFVRDASHLIDWVYDAADSLWRSRNFQNVITNGLELSAAFNLNQLVDEKFPIHHVGISYNYLNQEMEERVGVQSRYALENMRNQLIFSMDMTIVGKLKNSFKLRYIDRIEQESYLLIDDRLYYEQSKDFSVFLEATNLTGQKYTEVMIAMPGIWIRGGLTVKLDY
jgi:vitamin B12 transporter